MKKVKILVMLGLTLSACLATGKVLATNAESSQKTILSTDWMKELPNDLKLSEINIPGAHDAGTAHTTATVFSENTRCQTYYIGNHSYEDKSIFSDNKVVHEPGLLEQGVRFLDIRYDRTGSYDPSDEDDVEDRWNEIKNLPEKDRALSQMKFASERLVLAHGIYTCRYLESNSYGWRDWEDVDNFILMKWVKNFLDAHKDETVILSISAEDNDADDQERIASLVYDFYHNLAVYGGFGLFPELYVGDHSPTLGECRGKMVIFSDIKQLDLSIKDENDEVVSHWGMLTGYSEGDRTNKTYALAKTDPFMRSRIYKNNPYDGLNKEEKWEFIENGLNDGEGLHNKEKPNGYDAYLFLNTNVNRFLLGTPETFAEFENPKITTYIEDRNKKHEYHLYGILIMDFINDEDISSNISETLWSSNFYRDYSAYGYDFSGVNFEFKNNVPATATTIGDGNPWIIVGGAVILAALVTVGVIHIVKSKKTKQKVEE